MVGTSEVGGRDRMGVRGGRSDRIRRGGREGEGEKARGNI